MNLPDVLKILRERGVSLWAADGLLHYRAPSGTVTPDLLEGMAENKEQLIQHVEALADPFAYGSPEDSEAWRWLLGRAGDSPDNDPNGLWGSLHGLRCLGAKLEMTERGPHLRPGEISPAEYSRLRRVWLEPHTAEILLLLREMPSELLPEPSPEQSG